MGGKSGGVNVPDPQATAQAQGQANIDAALASTKLNQLNYVTPYGNLTYSGDFPVQPSSELAPPSSPGGLIGPSGGPAERRFDPGGDSYYVNSETGARIDGPVRQSQPAYSKVASAPTGDPRTATVTLPEDAQSALDAQNLLAKNLSQYANQLSPRAQGVLDAPYLGAEGVGDFSAQAEKAYFDRAYGLLSPEFQRQESSLTTDLVNRGLPRTGEAYSTEFGNFSKNRDDTLLRLAQDSVFAGQQYGSGLLGQQSAIRGQPINELAALLQGSPAINTPNFSGPGQVGVNPADFIGAQGQSISAQNANQANKAQAESSRNTLIGTAAMAAAFF